MIDLGPHAAFIWASYGLVTVTLAGLIVWLFVDGRRQAHALEDLKSRGVRRRSETS